QRNFRLFGPDETVSNRLDAVFTATSRQWEAESGPDDEWLAPEGRVLEMLSEHQCQGWLEGYLLTGRHGLFNSYEAFIHIVDSMVNQHAKWLEVTRRIPWRRPIASLNLLLSSHVWRQDHNGFTHQDPGFIDLVANKKAEVVRVYLPPASEHPHGLSDSDFLALFSRDAPIIFAYHGYPWLIHRLAYRHANHDNLHVRGYKEEGTITTPFDMAVLNDLDRFHLVMDVMDRVPGLSNKAAYVKQTVRDRLIEHRQYIYEHGEDMPAICDWRWSTASESRRRRDAEAAERNGAVQMREPSSNGVMG